VEGNNDGLLILCMSAANLSLATGLVFPGAAGNAQPQTPSCQHSSFTTLQHEHVAFPLQLPSCPQLHDLDLGTRKKHCTNRVALARTAKMSWAGRFSPAKEGGKPVLTAFRRIQEECQSRDHPGHDEDWYGMRRFRSALRQAAYNPQGTSRRQTIVTMR
jgi:hypothetical protein